jgi:hypothetical protein
MADQDTLEVSAWSVAASVGTGLLVVLAGLMLYGVGGVLVYVGIVTQPGQMTAIAAAYVVLAVVAPTAVARKMRRSPEVTWRRISAVCALIVVAVSVLFFPFAAILMVMGG